MIDRILLSFFFFYLSIGSLTAQLYHEAYRDECASAISFFKEYQSEFEKQAVNTGLPAEFLFALVAPEYTQFSYLSNKIESYSLKVFYIQGGKGYSDFSIGYFQMKPSFIELLEQYVKEHKELKKKYQDYLIKHPDSREARVERIKRLEQTTWQIDYLSLFCSIVAYKFPDKIFTGDKGKLQFYAAAYNSGFHKSEAAIETLAQKSLFPHFSKNKYRYADIAWWFYQELSKRSTRPA